MLAGLANTLPPEYSSWRGGLTYISPVVTAVVAWGAVEVSYWWGRRNLFSDVARAKRIRDEVIADPNASPEHKKNAQRAVELLESLVLTLISGHSSSVNVAAQDYFHQSLLQPANQPNHGLRKRKPV